MEAMVSDMVVSGMQSCPRRHFSIFIETFFIDDVNLFRVELPLVDEINCGIISVLGAAHDEGLISSFLKDEYNSFTLILPCDPAKTRFVVGQRVDGIGPSLTVDFRNMCAD